MFYGGNRKQQILRLNSLENEGQGRCVIKKFAE